jgi:hypothetical protein
MADRRVVPSEFPVSLSCPSMPSKDGFEAREFRVRRSRSRPKQTLLKQRHAQSRAAGAMVSLSQLRRLPT